MNFPAEIIVILWFLPVVLQIILPLTVLAVWPIVKLLKQGHSMRSHEVFGDAPLARAKMAVAVGD
ncbi:hypothetical protein [Desulfosediminicola sp.]|uniref:hypothetical protein n=1 Tax=Desulfosediminicola sp. TaxID=2886825 RepID=UPI003AF31201